MKEDLERDSLTVESIFPEIEEKNIDIIDTYYSFQNGLTLLKQLTYPSSRYPIAPDCEIPNSVIRALWKEEVYVKEVEIYVPDFSLGFISSKELLLTKGSSDGASEDADTVSTKDGKKAPFQRRSRRIKQSSKHKRISTLSRATSEDPKNSPFIQLCNQLFNEVWFPRDCEVELDAIVDQLLELLDISDSDIHTKVCNYILEFHGIKKIIPAKVSNIGQKVTLQLTNETDTVILTNCIQTLAGLNLKTDMTISMIKSFLNSENTDFRKTAKDALRMLGIKQESRYIPQDSISRLKMQPSEEVLSSAKKLSTTEVPVAIKKLPAKESKSRMKKHSTKEKVKKRSSKEDTLAKETAPSKEPVSETEGQAEKEPVSETEGQAEKEPVSETKDQAEKKKVKKRSSKEPVSETKDQAEKEKVKKRSSKEPVSDTKDQAEKEKVKKRSSKEPVSETKDQAEKEPVSETKDEAVKEPISETEDQAEKEPVSETEGQAEKDDGVKDQIEKKLPPKEPVSETKDQAEKEPVSETEGLAEKEPVSETEGQAEKEPVSETEDQAEKEPVSETKDEAEKKEAVAEEVMPSSVESTQVLQDAKDLQEDYQVKSVEEEKEKIAEEDFVEEKKIPEFPTEETLQEKEVLLDTDIDEIVEDDKERLEKDELPESLAEEEKMDLDSELISNEELKLPDDIAEGDLTKETADVKKKKHLKASKDRKRTPKESAKPPKESAKPQPVVSVKDQQSFGLTKKIDIQAKAQTTKFQHPTDIQAKAQTTKMQTLKKQKQSHELEQQHREKISKLADLKKNPFFLTKDALKSSNGKKPIKRPSHYFIGRDMAASRQQAPAVDKMRAALLPLSKGNRKYNSFVKQLNTIDRLPQKTTMKVKYSRSMLDTGKGSISNSQFQAQRDAKKELMEAVSFPVQETTATAIPPADAFPTSAAVPPVTVADIPPDAAATTAIPPDAATILPGAADATVIPGAADATVIPGAADALLPGAAAAIPPAAAADEAFFAKYQDIYPGSTQQVASREKEYPGIKSEEPSLKQIASWINNVLHEDFRDQVPAEEKLQKLSKSRRLSQKRDFGRKEIADEEKKIDSSKEGAQKFPWSSIRDYRAADMEGREQERRWPEDANRNIMKEQRKKEIRDNNREIGLSKKWTQKSLWSDIHKAFVDPSNRSWAGMMDAEHEQRRSSGDDWSKKRAYKVKTIADREEETHLIKRWVQNLPWSNIHKTFSDSIDRNLTAAKDAEWFQKSDYLRRRGLSAQRDFKGSSDLPWKMYADKSDSIMADLKATEIEQRWSESPGSRVYQKSHTITSSKLWSDKAFYPVDKLSPWMRHHLQYKPERIEEEEYVPSFELKNVSQTAPEWFSKYRRMMFSPDFYQHRERWLSDYRRPTSIIY